ncbi:hypothetical protein SLEP1_g25075 [Rubroshorea leprosula]|uniref:Uncharacterized protein n=1 Tax=Rubroshorea leprosula TaxID=152421 RepID=A0AAV5JHZ5_9ROSI|nr:hypothetical protein SLEP1_g25075 [Rubroshorea leprosula]
MKTEGKRGKMVALSLSRGELHKVPVLPDVPPRWLTPTCKIFLRDFKNLLQRRNKALSCSGSSSNPNPDSKQQIEIPKVDEAPWEVRVEAGTLGALKPGVQVEVTDKGGGSEAKGRSEKPVDEAELKREKEGG